jgi:hypothetical protein
MVVVPVSDCELALEVVSEQRLEFSLLEYMVISMIDSSFLLL